MIPIIDLEKDYFVLRLSDECLFDKNDGRNILFDIKEEISDYDGGYLKRLDKLVKVFKNSIDLLEIKINQLETEWGRDGYDE